MTKWTAADIPDQTGRTAVITGANTGLGFETAAALAAHGAHRRYRRVAAYGQAKLANLLFTYELQRRLAPGGTTIAVASHPGVSNTELVRNMPRPLVAVAAILAPLMQDAELGALPTLRAATDPAVRGGQYFGPDGFGEIRGYPKVVASSAQSHDEQLQRRLWAVSEELTGVVYPVG